MIGSDVPDPLPGNTIKETMTDPPSDLKHLSDEELQTYLDTSLEEIREVFAWNKQVGIEQSRNLTTSHALAEYIAANSEANGKPLLEIRHGS
jgi:hypothetical protein